MGNIPLAIGMPGPFELLLLAGFGLAGLATVGVVVFLLWRIGNRPASPPPRDRA